MNEPELINKVSQLQRELRECSMKAQDEAFWRIAHHIDTAVRELDKIQLTVTKKEAKKLQQVRNCVNCKNLGVDPASEPCYSCAHQQHDNWEEN